MLNDNTRSWSYRLAAGADLTAADPLAVRDRSGDNAGDLRRNADRHRALFTDVVEVGSPNALFAVNG